MKYLIIAEPIGEATIHLIDNLGVSPADIFVWEDSTKGQECVKMEGANVSDNIEDYADMKFDVIIGNPPYQSTSNSGNTLWDKFIVRCLDMLKPGGSLRFITPPRWRQPDDRLSYIYREYQLVSVHMHTVKEGQSTFGASTPYDVYHIEKVAPYKKTLVTFTDGVSGEYDVTVMPFIPNSMIDFWLTAFSQDKKITVHQSYSHEARLKHVVKTQDNIHCYPILEKINQQGCHHLYSSKQHEHQDTPKLCFRDQGTTDPVLNTSSGCGRHIYYVLDTSSDMKSFLESDLFEDIKKSVTFSIRYISHKPLCYMPCSVLSQVR